MEDLSVLSMNLRKIYSQYLQSKNKEMKKITTTSFSILLALTLMLSSCETIRQANSKQKGAVIGAAGGAAAGAIIGKQIGDGNSILGAIIGGVIGGAAGTYIGDRMDRQAEQISQEIPGAEVTRVGEGINVTFDEAGGVHFETSKYNINASSAETLDKLANIMNEYSDTNILIEGHTDSTGSDAFNLTLSEKRAKSVSAYLQKKGIDASRLTTKWYGESQPKYDNTTLEGRAKNRRVEVAIVANEDLKKEAKEKTSGETPFLD